MSQLVSSFEKEEKGNKRRSITPPLRAVAVLNLSYANRQCQRSPELKQIVALGMK
jgi:hypothetical protein